MIRSHRLTRSFNSLIIVRRTATFWQLFKAQLNRKNVIYQKRIAGFQPMKTELVANRTYYWCTCGYSQSQAMCDKTCRKLNTEFHPLKFTCNKATLADLCMCKSSQTAPYCDQSCDTRYAGFQQKMSDGVTRTYSNFKSLLETVPKGIENYRQFAANRQEKLESIEHFVGNDEYLTMNDRKVKRSRLVGNDSTWDCSLCTYKNPCVAFRCEMCDSRKGTATRKPKLVVTDHVERLPRSKRKTDDDYSSEGSSTEETDPQDEDDDDDDDEEFQHGERKPNQSNQNHRRRSTAHHDHLNESISSPASSTTTTRSYRSASPSSSSKLVDSSKLSNNKRRPLATSISRSIKSASTSLTNTKKSNNDNENKRSNLNSSSRKLNDTNAKNKTTSNEQTRKNLAQRKKKKSKLSSLSSMSSSSSTTSNSSSTRQMATTTTITVDGVSVRIKEFLAHERHSMTTTDPSRTSSLSPRTRTDSQSDK